MQNCPQCGEKYGLLDFREAVPHRIARRLQSWAFPVSGVWSLILLIAVIVLGVFYKPVGGTAERGVGWAILSLPAIPGVLLYAISWMFPNVRLFRCRHCGHQEELVLREPDI